MKSSYRWFVILGLVCLMVILIWWPSDVQISSDAASNSSYSSDRYKVRENIATPNIMQGLPLKPCSNEQRLAYLHARCEARKNRTMSSFSDHPDPFFYWRLLVDDRHKALYCVIPKAACTTWKTTMVNLTGVELQWKRPWLFNVHSENHLETVGLKYLYHFSREEIIERLNTYFKFIIVRHPLDRIQSAYSNKVMTNGSDSGYYKNTYDHIISKYRTKPKEIAEADGGPISLEEFMSFIANEYPVVKDRHFQSFEDLCHPCDIKYDYIAKVETLDTDTKNLLNLLLKEETAGMMPKKLNVGQHNSSKGRLKILSKFKHFPKEMMNLYYEKFSLDFDLFGYNFGENGEVVCQSGDSQCC